MAAHEDLVEVIRFSYANSDLSAISPLLADDVRWGDDDHPNRCRSREDVLRTFGSWVETGVTANVIGTQTGPDGVSCHIHVNWAETRDRARGIEFFHVFMVRDDRIVEIRRYDDAESAAEAVGS